MYITIGENTSIYPLNNTMYIQISEARLVPDGYGNRIEITKV